jgi:hypothetical protein
MPDFDWKVDEEAAWEQLEQLPAPSSPPRRPNRWLWGGVVIVVLVTALLFYIRLDRQAAQTDSNLTEEVTAAFRMLWHADRQRDLDLFAQLRHDTGLNAWRTEIDRAFANGLLFERAALGFSLADGEPEVMAVTFSPDWQTAVLTAQIAYDIAFDPGPVYLIYPLFYERIEGQWLLVPPPDDYWGNMVEANGRYLTLLYPEVDAELASRLHDDLETAVSQACDDLAQPVQSVAFHCPSDLSITLRLQPRPGSLDWLLIDTVQEQVRILQQTVPRQSSLNLRLPAFPLLGLAKDEASYTVMRHALSYWVLALLLDAQIGYEQPSVLRWLWLQARLEQLGFAVPPAPPAHSVALIPPQHPPQAEVALLCAGIAPVGPSIDLLRLTPETAQWSVLAADVRHNQLAGLVQGQLLGLRSVGSYEAAQREPLLLYPDGTPLPLPSLPDKASVLGWLAQPGEQTELAFAWSGHERLTLDLASCLGADDTACQWFASGNWLPRSPDGRHWLAVYHAPEATEGTGLPLGLMRQDSVDESIVTVDIALNLSITWGEPATVSVGMDLPPFWLDDRTYGFMRVPVAPNTIRSHGHRYFEIVIADIADDEPQPFLTSGEIRAALPANPQIGLIILQSMQPIAGHPDQFALIAIAFPADPSPGQPPVSVALHYDRTDDELRLLTYGEALALSPNGRFLIQIPTDIFGSSFLRRNNHALQIEWHDLATGVDQQITWPAHAGLATPLPTYDWSVLEDWFLILVDNTLLLVDASVPQSGYVIPLANHLGQAYRCFDAVWMKAME